MFLRKDATKHLVIRVDKVIRKTTIYAKIALSKKSTKITKKRQVYPPTRHMNKVGQIYEGVSYEIFSL
ncbi:hypothetical protein [Neobacillus drentensis]|uniref:hypothetical protein n=1 Tax=Neobacillus drentensis TaxID=220684 RepID=UPI003000753F